MKYINCTPHQIKLNSGKIFNPSGTVTRVSSTFIQVAGGPACFYCGQESTGYCYYCGCDAPIIEEECEFEQVFGDVQDLPEPIQDTKYIVSALVLAALRGSRFDVVAPATGHKDAIRNNDGQIISVPGFVK